MNKKTLIKVCAVTCGLGLTLAGCTSSNNSNEINNTKYVNIVILRNNEIMELNYEIN